MGRRYRQIFQKRRIERHLRDVDCTELRRRPVGITSSLYNSYRYAGQPLVECEVERNLYVSVKSVITAPCSSKMATADIDWESTAANGSLSSLPFVFACGW